MWILTPVGGNCVTPVVAQMTKLRFNDFQPSNVQALVLRLMVTSTDQTSPMELFSVSVVSEDFN